jgi:aspartate/methionine/tyrosine aminotransferase
MSTDTTSARSQTADRLRAFGETIFTPISALAAKHGAINLGQGFPNFDGPDFVKDAAIEAMRAGHNQYARMYGIPELNAAIADWFSAGTSLSIDPEAETTVTSGCTEAIPATLLGLINPGEKVIVFEPYYDSYPASLSMAGAEPIFVTLRPPDFAFDPDALRRAFALKPRAIIINTPHNPSGKVYGRDELQLIADLCIEHDVLAVTDEVYERLVFEGEHIRIATFDGMYERTVSLSSLGKTFSLTGWKIGWAVGPPHLIKAVRSAHQYLTFATATPLQHGAVAALRAPQPYFDEFLAAYRRRRDVLCDGLAEIGFRIAPPAGTYFALADHTPFGFDDDVTFCRHLIEHVGVATIPPSAFYHDPTDGSTLIRFSFCQDEDMLQEAVHRMREKL